MALDVDAPTYVGPLDVLFQLVSSHEVDILDIPLAPVVDAFVAHLRERRDTCSMDELSEFLLYAALLVELKSQRLLPGPDDVDADEETIGWEERDVLLARLLELRAYAAIADGLARSLEAAGLAVPRVTGLDDSVEVHAPDLLAGVTPFDLAAAYLRGIEDHPTAPVVLDHMTVETVTVAETVVDLARMLPTRGALSFRELIAGLTDRIEIIVRFLAVLELCKLGRVALGQGTTFGELQIRWVHNSSESFDLGLVDDYAG
ncbi:MAG TPA: ScpA family protein [Acidimicrobiales bacterium]|jgi:segregation and condensation protein A|nr:ScpA family protein [Acidimicrobiales bacterium]